MIVAVVFACIPLAVFGLSGSGGRISGNASSPLDGYTKVCDTDCGGGAMRARMTSPNSIEDCATTCTLHDHCYAIQWEVETHGTWNFCYLIHENPQNGYQSPCGQKYDNLRASCWTKGATTTMTTTPSLGCTVAENTVASLKSKLTKAEEQQMSMCGEGHVGMAISHATIAPQVFFTPFAMAGAAGILMGTFVTFLAMKLRPTRQLSASTRTPFLQSA